MAITLATSRSIPYPLHSQFDRLLSKIKPPHQRLDLAQEFPDLVRAVVERSPLVETVAPHTRLGGSYGRLLAVKLIKDVDVLVIVKSAYYFGAPSIVLDALLELARSLSAALDMKGEIITRPQQRSVRVRFHEVNFDLDLVPVLGFGALEGPLYVPDRKLAGWVETRPIGYAAYLTDLSQQHDRRLRRLIRLLKHWREEQGLHLDRRTKSFWIECMVVNLVRSGMLRLAGRGMAEIVADTFTALHATGLPTLQRESVPFIADPMLPASNVAFNWEFEKFSLFMNRLEEARDAAATATSTSARGVAVESWQRVFGASWFATSEDEAQITEELKQLGMVAATTGTFLGQGRVSTTPASSSVHAKPHRFYGDET